MKWIPNRRATAILFSTFLLFFGISHAQIKPAPPTIVMYKNPT
jgi:hypothetical protein